MLFRCYTPELKQPTIGHAIELSSEASHHIAKVLRHVPGDELLIFSNNDGDYQATIVSLKPRVVVTITSHLPNKTESPLKLHLVQGLARNERMDIIIQKATELGVAQITPVITEKVQIKLPQDKWPKKKEHWEQIIISATEQSGRCVTPPLHDLIALKKLVTSPDLGPAIIFHPRATQSLKDYKFEGEALTVFIGPESGFSDEEYELLKTVATPLLMGPRILRTETAAITALSLCQGLWGDLNG